LALRKRRAEFLERLGHKLSDVEVDYEAFAGVHNFNINHGGTRFRVQFAEQTLRRKSVEDLEEAVHKASERVLSKNLLRPLQYRS
jgi:hypothetical protein